MTAEPGRVGGLILAGGKSSRMGAEKAGLVWRGEPFLAHVARALGAAVPMSKIVVSVASPDTRAAQLAADLGLAVAVDTLPDSGPLAGFAAGLAVVTDLGCAGAVVATCDSPGLSALLVSGLVHLTGDSLSSAVLAHGDQHFAPFPGYYPARAGAVAAQLLAGGEFRVSRLVARLDAVELPAESIERCDPARASWRNLNTPAEYEAFIREY